MTNNKKARVYALLAIFLWSTVATAFKVALKVLTPLELVFCSTLWSTVILFIIILVKGEYKALFHRGSQFYFRMILGALLNPTLYYIVLFAAYDRLPAQLAQPLNYTWPILLILLSIPLLKQKPKLQDYISLIFCFIGICVLSQGGGSNNQSVSVIGISLALLSALIWALYWVFNRKYEGEEELRLFLSFLFAIPVLLVIMGVSGDISIPVNPETLLSSLYIGLFEMGITFVLWGKALKFAERSADISNLVYLSPFLSLFWIALILGETIYPTTVIGLITIVVGLLLGKLNLSKTREVAS